MDIDPKHLQLMGIFQPLAVERLGQIAGSGARFVHYTSAHAGLQILRNQEIWMRKSSCMNDFMEVEHGLRCIYTAYQNSEGGKAFRQNLDSIDATLRAESESLFDGWTPHIRNNTYFTCISEHDAEEDTFGRLSMWRAYSESTGIGLVVKNAPFVAASDTLKAYTSPVAYLNDAQVGEEFGRIAQNIKANEELLRATPREDLKGYIFSMLRYAAICTKHPGFREEREWRVIYSPSLESSTYITKDIQTIRGTPQPIYKIPLKQVPDLPSIAIADLLDRIIIGPTDYPVAMQEAFIDVLVQNGVQEPANKVFCSDIPLRR